MDYDFLKLVEHANSNINLTIALGMSEMIIKNITH